MYGLSFLTLCYLHERNWLSRWNPVSAVLPKDIERGLLSVSWLCGIIIAEFVFFSVFFRGTMVDCFAEWPELRRLRHAYSSAREQGGVVSPAVVLVSPASLFVSPIWFKAVEKDDTWRWYWTPYAQHKDHEWMPVSKTTVDTTPRRMYQGSAPAKHNVRIIQFLHDNESETAKKAVESIEHELFTM